MNNILKDGSGNILKDSLGNIVKERPLNQSVIQDGLQFWGQADVNYLTIVDGLVSEAYDIRGTGVKFSQSTITKRPYLSANKLVMNGTTLNSSLFGYSHLFIVLQNTGGSNNYKGIGVYNNPFNTLGFFSNAYTGHMLSNDGGIDRIFYINNTKYTTRQGINTNKIILHTVTPITNNPIVGLRIGNIIDNAPNNEYLEVYEWGAYNRLLSEAEIFYNINALNAKYSIF